jgi:hypothetical protein
MGGVRKTSVYLVMEHDNPKDKERMEEYRNLVADEFIPYLKKIKDLAKFTSLSDNTGHMIGIYEFKDWNAFGKVWNDDDFRALGSKLSRLVKNNKIRLCRRGRLRGKEI